MLRKEHTCSRAFVRCCSLNRRYIGDTVWGCAMSDLQTRAPRFLRWLHDDQAGYIEIVAGVVLDPERPDKIILLQPTRDNPDRINTRKWFYLDPERPDLYTAAGDYAT